MPRATAGRRRAHIGNIAPPPGPTTRTTRSRAAPSHGAEAPPFDDSIDKTALSRECIVYLYGLLFLFYVEARGTDLGVVPMAHPIFRVKSTSCRATVKRRVAVTRGC